MICDEKGMAAIQSVSGGACQFLEVQGMPTQDGKCNILVTPVHQVPNEPGEAIPDV